MLEAPGFNRQLPPTAASLRRFNDNAGVRAGIDQLTTFSNELSPTLRFITPAQSACNYATLLFSNVADTLRLGNSLGNWQRFNLISAPGAPERAEQRGSPVLRRRRAAEAETRRTSCTSTPTRTRRRPVSRKECEAGREQYIAGQAVIGNVPGNQGVTPECRRLGGGG